MSTSTASKGCIAIAGAGPAGMASALAGRARCSRGHEDRPSVIVESTAR